MLKVYGYCLSTVLVIDTANKTIFITYAGTIKQADSEAKAREKAKKITKATIKRHINKYGEFVIGVPILTEYAPEYVREYDKGKGYIGAFADWSALQKFFIALEEASKPFFAVYSSCNDWADIIDSFVKVKRGLSDFDKNFYAKNLADEKSSFHESAKREKTLIDLFDSAPHLLNAS
jgi:hypothetical protein